MVFATFKVFAVSGSLCGLCGAVLLLGGSQRLSMSAPTDWAWLRAARHTKPNAAIVLTIADGKVRGEK